MCHTVVNTGTCGLCIPERGRCRGEGTSTQMPSVVKMSDYRKKNSGYSGSCSGNTRFDRRELEQLLTLYSRRVMIGEWKDYAILHEPGMAAFFIYRNTRAQPHFTLVKRDLSGSRTEFVLYSGSAAVKRSRKLEEALSPMKSRVSLIKS